MTLLDEAVAAIRRMSTRDRDEIARTMIAMTRTSAGSDSARSVVRDGKIDPPGEDAGPGPIDDFRLWPRRGRR